MTIPNSIRSVIERRPSRVSRGLRMPVERGQVLRVRMPGAGLVPERMVLVLRMDSHQQSRFVEIMLVHSHIELAASSDLVISPEHSTLPYRIVAQADARGVVWTHQLGALIGAIDDVALKALGDVAVGQPKDREGLIAGPPLRGRLDPRWDFKGQEGAAIRSLAADCTTALLYDGPPLQLDPGCLVLNLIAVRGDLKTTLHKLLDLVTNYDVVFDLDDIAVLAEVGALNISNWTKAFGSLGHDLYRSFSPLVDRALSVVDLPRDPVTVESIDEWTSYRNVNAGTCRRRPGYHGVSASYVFERDREKAIRHADEHGYQLIDA